MRKKIKKETRGAPEGNTNASKKKKGGYVQREHRFSQRLDIGLCRRIDSYKEEHNMSEKAFLLYAISLVLGDV